MGRSDLAILYLSLFWHTEKKKTISLAASNRDDVLFKFLLTHGADPKLTDEHHRTAVNLTLRLSFLSTSPSLSLLLLRCKRRQQHPALGHPAPRIRPHPPPHPPPPLSRQPHQRAGNQLDSPAHVKRSLLQMTPLFEVVVDQNAGFLMAGVQTRGLGIIRWKGRFVLF